MRKFFIFLAVLGALGTILFYSRYMSAVHFSLNPSGSSRVIVDIAQGSSGTQIARQLYDKGLIKSPTLFKLYVKEKGLEGQMKAGRMIFQENFALPEIVETLVAGKSEEFPVTLLEGWTALQIGEYLEEKGLTSSDNFMACFEQCDFDFNFLPEGSLEGYLYPDTYYVSPQSYSDEAFITRLITTLNEKLTDDDWAAINASEKDFSQIMIMASIVEREERNDAEKATVAGILWNRFDTGMGLGADATVLYALGRTSGGLSYADLQVDSPYNTRKYAGLPPTPIANPGLSSIRASLYPEETDYWYYLHGSDGKIHYGRSLEEHNANKARYLN